MATERRAKTARDYGPRTSTLLRNQALRFEQTIEAKRQELFEMKSNLWRAKREIQTLIRLLNLSDVERESIVNETRSEARRAEVDPKEW